MLDVVAGLLMRDGNALLGLRKAAGKRGGLWETPGGKCDERQLPDDPWKRETIRERHEAALRREWQEELDLNIVVGTRIATAMLDLEVCFTVSLYEVVTLEEPKPLDHDALRWVNLAYAVEYMPCSPALYLHWPAIRSWLQTQRRLGLSTP